MCSKTNTTEKTRKSMPFMSELHPDLSGYFKEAGLKTPTSIQRKVIPEILSAKSVIVLAETGSGKTLSYALPIVSKTKEREEQRGPKTVTGPPLVLGGAPTRESAVQIQQGFKGTSHPVELRIRDLAGGDTHAKVKSVANSSYDI